MIVYGTILLNLHEFNGFMILFIIESQEDGLFYPITQGNFLLFLLKQGVRSD